MAYFRKFPGCQFQGCTKRAGGTIMSRTNAQMGDFCDKHAAIQLKAFQRIEDTPPVGWNKEIKS